MKMSNQEAIEILREKISPCVDGEWKKSVDMAISALQAQDVPDTNVGDTVSRQAAIDALCRRCDLAAEDDEPCTEKCNDIKILEKLPSAQPELGKNTMPEQPKIDKFGVKTGETCADTISRQAAIDAFGDVHPLDYNAQAYLSKIKALPSAQPEIIRCKDCEYGEQDDIGRWFCNDLGCQMGNEDGSGYCANAERRTDEGD